MHHLLTHDLLAHEGGHVPPVTFPGVFALWEFDPYLITGVGTIGVLYLYGAWLLRRRGDRWSSWRVFFFVLGLGSIFVATQSALGVYDTTLFSTHIVQHVILSMLAPVFLALGAPVTLALRTLAKRPRKGLLIVLHSRLARILAFPLVSLVLFAGSMVALYYTSWYEATLRNPFLHDMQHVHFVLVGCLFFWPLVGLDPVPGRLPHLARMGVAFLATPVHAALGIALMMSGTVLAAGWYLDDHRVPWVDALQQQNVGGAILWGIGDIVNIVIGVTLFVQWMRADEREAARIDRQLDRRDARRRPVDAAAERVAAEQAAGEKAAGEKAAAEKAAAEEAEFAAYNAMLARLNQRDG